ncbi:MAG TPA: RDD family protein [Nanoarchaeota archaeon]|nr:RDD family protein [Nanoarchaeota archaeon]HIH58800.1 RDD family protein [Nanoarchaeota archaeon]HII13669.1 RDD family protein [Nanoarchaeota archaeon]HIJ04784.1 RDD family protein [Nanoarchaeota archaeon]
MGKVIVVPLWKRIFAYFLDVFLLSFLVLTPLLKPFSFDAEIGESFFQRFTSFSASFSADYIWLAFVVAFFFLLYFSVLETWFGQTVGKIIVGISVESTKKKPLGFLQAVIRNIPKLSGLLLLLDTLYLFFKKGNQRYFEVLSDTHVVVADGENHA